MAAVIDAPLQRILRPLRVLRANHGRKNETLNQTRQAGRYGS